MSADTPKGPPNSYITLESRAASFFAPKTVPPALLASLPDSMEVEDKERVDETSCDSLLLVEAVGRWRRLLPREPRSV